jgi:hypothetical protein
MTLKVFDKDIFLCNLLLSLLKTVSTWRVERLIRSHTPRFHPPPRPSALQSICPSGSIMAAYVSIFLAARLVSAKRPTGKNVRSGMFAWIEFVLEIVNLYPGALLCSRYKTLKGETALKVGTSRGC